MRSRSVFFTTFLLATALLAGCGQKGPLYMPDDTAAQKRYDPQDAYHDQRGQQRDAPSQDAEPRPRPGAAGDSINNATSTGDNATTPGNDSSTPDAPYNQTPGDAAPVNSAPTPN